MNVTTENKDQHTLIIEVQTTVEEVEQSIKTATQRIAGQVSIPGFRKGKAPRKVLENRIGSEAFMSEAFEILLEKSYPKALEELDVEPVVRPEIEKIVFEEGKAGEYKATVVVKPKIKLSDYKGIEVSKNEPVVTEEQIAQQLAEIQKHRAKLVDAGKDAKAEKNDMAMIDFLGKVDGVPFEGGEGKSYPLELGSNSFIPGFEAQVEGMAVGEDKVITVTFPEDYSAEELKGKEATFDIHLHSIKKREMPELNDDFAKEVAKVDTLEDLKEETRKRLQSNAEVEVEREFRAAVLKKLVDSVEVEIPPVMIESRVNNLLTELDLNLQNSGANLDVYLQHSKKTIAEVKSDYEEVAFEGVKTDLVLEEIVRQEKMGVSQKELDVEMRAMSVSYDIPMKNVKSYIEKEGHMGNLVMNVLRRKAAELVITSAKQL